MSLMEKIKKDALVMMGAAVAGAWPGALLVIVLTVVGGRLLCMWLLGIGFFEPYSFLGTLTAVTGFVALGIYSRRKYRGREHHSE